MIRHFFNARHEGKGSPWWTWGVAAAGMLAIAWLSAAGPRQATTAGGPRNVSGAVAHNIVLSRCSMCHTEAPVWPGVHAPPKNVLLDNAESIERHAGLIDINAVRSRAMPPGNVTQITDQERQILAAWISSRMSSR